MKLTTKLSLWTMGAFALALIAVKPASAVTSQVLDIHVSITATKSLSAGTTFYNFGALAPDVSSNSASAIQITNDSGAYVETYTLQGANATSDTGGTNWTLAASTGTNQYSIGAQFSTAQPANTQPAWDSTDYLTTSAQACSATQFGNGTLAEAGTSVSPVVANRDRYLWFKIHTPDISTGTEGRTAQITIAVQ